MRYKRVLLVRPQYRGSFFGPLRPPVGLGALSEVLFRERIDHDVLDMQVGYKKRHLFRKIKDYRPDLIGVSMMTFRHFDTFQMIQEIKEQFCVDVVIGGPHVSIERESLLRKYPAVDYGVTLEGEQTLAELCQGKELAQIKGLIYKDGSRVKYNGGRPFIRDLDDLPFPRYKKLELRRYGIPEIPILTSRGCPFKCIFCPINLVIGKLFRYRSPENVVEEIEYWYNRGYRQFAIADDNFTLGRNRVLQFCGLVKEKNFTGISFTCPSGIRADRVDRNLLTTMKDVGFLTLMYGVEAGNNKVLRNLNKGESIETIEEAIKLSCEIRFDVNLFFLVGSPGETWDDLMDSVNLAMKYPLVDARFFNLIPFPGTTLYNWVLERGYFVKHPEDYLNSTSRTVLQPVFATPELSLEERKKALKLTERVSKTICRRYIERSLSKLGSLSKLASSLFVFNPIYRLLKKKAR